MNVYNVKQQAEEGVMKKETMKMRMCQNDINPLNVMVWQIELFPLSINCLFLLLLFITDLFFSSVFLG